MKTKFFKTLILTLSSTLAATLIVACASNPAEDQFTAEEMALLAETETQQPAVLSPAAELAAIDAELSSVEAQLAAAQTRLSAYQTQNKKKSINRSQITGAEAEISHYQNLKSTLMSRKQSISTQSTIK